MKFKIIAILIIVLWLPFGVPFIGLGALARFVVANLVFGYEGTDLILSVISRNLRKETK